MSFNISALKGCALQLQAQVTLHRGTTGISSDTEPNVFLF